MATPGTIISGIGHAGLMVWLIAGWGFNAEPLQIETMDVSVISGEEFDQMRARATPEPGNADPQAPVPPVVDENPPPPPEPEQPAQPTPPPEPVTPPEPEAPPPPPPPPLADAEVTDVQPPAPDVPEAPPPQPDLEVSEQPTPPQAPTVASELNTPPPPDARPDDIVRDEVTPSDTTEPDIAAEEQEATAPEETTTAIVIEDLAPTTSVRPASRPSRPAPTPVAQAEPDAPEPAEPDTSTPSEPETPPTTATEDDVAAALADALAGADAPAVAAGPPMTGAERDSFRIAVNSCWNVDPGSVAARVTVEVGFNLDREGRVIGNEVRLISSDGDQSATNTAFEAARRAILRCQSGGYQLPADKYDQWQDVVITFDPSGMRLR